MFTIADEKNIKENLNLNYIKQDHSVCRWSDIWCLQLPRKKMNWVEFQNTSRPCSVQMEWYMVFTRRCRRWRWSVQTRLTRLHPTFFHCYDHDCHQFSFSRNCHTCSHIVKYQNKPRSTPSYIFPSLWSSFFHLCQLLSSSWHILSSYCPFSIALVMIYIIFVLAIVRTDLIQLHPLLSIALVIILIIFVCAICLSFFFGQTRIKCVTVSAALRAEQGLI